MTVKTKYKSTSCSAIPSGVLQTKLLRPKGCALPTGIVVVVVATKRIRETDLKEHTREGRWDFELEKLYRIRKKNPKLAPVGACQAVEGHASREYSPRSLLFLDSRGRPELNLQELWGQQLFSLDLEMRARARPPHGTWLMFLDEELARFQTFAGRCWRVQHVPA